MQNETKSQVLMSLLIVAYLAATLCLFAVAWFSFIENNGIAISEKYNWFVVAFYMVLTLFLDKTYSAFKISYLKPKRLIFSQSLANLIAICFIFFSISVVWESFYWPLAFVVLLVAQIVFNIFWCYLADAVWFKFHAPLATFILYGNEADLVRLEDIRGYTRKFRIVKEFSAEEKTVEEILEKIAGAEALFAVGVETKLRDRLMLHCLEHSIEGFFQPEIQDIVQAGTKQIHAFGAPLSAVEIPKPDPVYQVVKRTCAFVLALLLLILLSPVMIATALAIRIFGPTGPVIFKQSRMGRGMKPFTCYKFRTMSTRAPHDCHPRDFDAASFLTPLGSFLREASLDELPQIFNILEGDMCFIGPRPIPLTEKELIRQRGMFGVYQLYPGIPGLAQVSGRNDVNDVEKLMFDYEYLLKISLLLDIKIFFKTVLLVLLRRGVYVKKAEKNGS